MTAAKTPASTPTVQDVINRAIRENRTAEILLYCFTVLFVVVGAVVIIWSLIRNSPATGAVGVASSVLFVPGITNARRIRKENLMIRLMEVPLTRAETADDAARIVTLLFQQSLQEPPPRSSVKGADATT